MTISFAKKKKSPSEGGRYRGGSALATRGGGAREAEKKN